MSPLISFRSCRQIGLSTLVCLIILAASPSLPLLPANASPVPIQVALAQPVNDSTRKEIEIFVERFAKAYGGKDADALGALLTDDFQARGPIDPKPTDRKTVLSGIKDALAHLTDLKVTAKLIEATQTGDRVQAVARLQATLSIDQGNVAIPLEIEQIHAMSLTKSSDGWKIQHDDGLLDRATSKGKAFALGESPDVSAIRPVIKMLYDDVATAYLAGDKTALGKLLTDDYVVETLGGPPTNKTQLLDRAATEHADGRYAALKFEVVRIIPDGNTATAHVIITLTQNVKDQEGKVTQVPIRVASRESLKQVGSDWKLVKSTWLYMEVTSGGKTVIQYRHPAP